MRSDRPLLKSDLIQKVADKLGASVPKKDVESAVNEIFDAMTTAMCEGDRIEIRGFGSFTLRLRKARDGRNPRTGQRVNVPSKRVPHFTVGKELKERINGDDGADGV